MEKQNAKVNYFFGDIYKDCRNFILRICKTIINVVLFLYGFIIGLVRNSLSCSWDIIKGVFERWIDSIGDPWESVGESFVDFKDAVVDDIIGHIDFGDMFTGFFKAIFYIAKFGFFLSYAIINVILTPVICFLFTIMFLGAEIALLLAIGVGVTGVAAVLCAAMLIVMAISYVCMGIIALGIGISFCFMAFLDLMYRMIHRLKNSCPECQAKFDLPIYVCDCGRKHTRLIPSKYGILKRTCECGRKLPTMFFNGRQKLHSICPKCQHDIAGGMHTEVWIPVIGGPSAGKTCFINMAITKISNEVAPSHGLNFTYHQHGEDLYEENKKNLDEGLLPQKTSDMNYKFYQFNLEHKGSQLGNMISLCDVAGELYADNATLTTGVYQGGFQEADGFILVIDPLSLADCRAELESNDIEIADYGACDKPMSDILDTLFSIIESMQNTSKAKLKPSCAVVFTKCDIPGIDEKLGEEAINSHMAANDEDRLTALNEICENFILTYDPDLLNKIKQSFTSYQFFTCSALGHNADGSEFAPVHVEDSVLWIIEKCCSLNFYKNGDLQ